MLTLDRDEVAARLPYAALIEAIRVGLAAPIETPARAHHLVAPPEDLLLVMPSWRMGERIGVKLTSVYPGNVARGLPMIHALYTLIDGRTGIPQAVLNGTELTLRRTAALAALATERLAARPGGRLLVMGTGALSLAMIEAHHALGPWHSVSVWGRTQSRAEEIAGRAADRGVVVEAERDAERAVRAADVICCVTAAREPILRGAWVTPGTHVNLFGAYMPSMREGDSDLVAEAALYVDSREAALHEAGDVLIPIGEGRIEATAIRADMRDLIATRPAVETARVTVFKSVGFGALDLIAAERAIQPA